MNEILAIDNFHFPFFRQAHNGDLVSKIYIFSQVFVGCFIRHHKTVLMYRQYKAKILTDWRLHCRVLQKKN